MADNQQNTYTGGAGPLVASTGNGILDGFLKLTNVAVQGASSLYGVYDTIKERQLAREIAYQNATNPPSQNLPASVVNSAADYLSNAENVQRLFFYAGAALLLSVGTVYAFKKVL